MTVDKLVEKLKKLQAEGYGDSKVMLGAYAGDGTFYPSNEIRSCYGFKSGENEICGIATSLG